MREYVRLYGVAVSEEDKIKLLAASLQFEVACTSHHGDEEERKQVQSIVVCNLYVVINHAQLNQLYSRSRVCPQYIILLLITI